MFKKTYRRPKPESSAEQSAEVQVKNFCDTWLDEKEGQALTAKFREGKITVKELTEIEATLKKEIQQDSFIRVNHDLAKERSGLTQAKFTQRTIGQVKQHIYELSKIFGSVKGKGYSADLERKQTALTANEQYRKQVGHAVVERKIKLQILDTYFKASPKLKEVFTKFNKGEIPWNELANNHDLKETLPRIVEQWCAEGRSVQLGDQDISLDDPAMRGQLLALAHNEILELAQLSKWEHEATNTKDDPTTWRNKIGYALSSATLWSSGASLALRWGGRSALAAGAAAGGWAVVGGVIIGMAAGAGTGYIRERMKRTQRAEAHRWQMIAGEQLGETAFVQAKELILKFRSCMVELANPQITTAEIENSIALAEELKAHLDTDTIAYGTEESRSKVQHELMQLLSQLQNGIISAASRAGLSTTEVGKLRNQHYLEQKNSIIDLKKRTEQRHAQEQQKLELRGAVCGALMGGVMGGISPFAFDRIHGWLGTQNVALASNVTTEKSLTFVTPRADGIQQVADVKIADAKHLNVSIPGKNLGGIDMGANGPLPAKGVHAEVIQTNSPNTILRLQDTSQNKIIGDVAIQIKAENILDQLTRNEAMQSVLRQMGIPKEAVVLTNGALSIDESKLPSGSYLMQAGSWRAGRMENILRAWQLNEHPTQSADIYVARAELAEWYKQNQDLSVDEAVKKAWGKPVEMIQKFQKSYEGPLKSTWQEAVSALDKTNATAPAAPVEVGTTPSTSSATEVSTPRPMKEIPPVAQNAAEPAATVPPKITDVVSPPAVSEPSGPAKVDLPTPPDSTTNTVLTPEVTPAPGDEGYDLSEVATTIINGAKTAGKIIGAVAAGAATAYGAEKGIRAVKKSLERRRTAKKPNATDAKKSDSDTFVPFETPRPATLPNPEQRPIQEKNTFTVEEINEHFPEITSFDEFSEELHIGDKTSIDLFKHGFGICYFDKKISFSTGDTTSLCFKYGDGSHFIAFTRVQQFEQVYITIEHNLSNNETKQESKIIESADEFGDFLKACLQPSDTEEIPTDDAGPTEESPVAAAPQPEPSTEISTPEETTDPITPVKPLEAVTDKMGATETAADPELEIAASENLQQGDVEEISTDDARPAEELLAAAANESEPLTEITGKEEPTTDEVSNPSSPVEPPEVETDKMGATETAADPESEIVTSENLQQSDSDEISTDDAGPTEESPVAATYESEPATEIVANENSEAKEATIQTPESADTKALAEKADKLTKESENLLRSFKETFINGFLAVTSDGDEIIETMTTYKTACNLLKKSLIMIWSDIPFEDQGTRFSGRRPFKKEKEKTTVANRLKFLQTEADKRIDRAHEVLRKWFSDNVANLNSNYEQHKTLSRVPGNKLDDVLKKDLLNSIYRLQDAANDLVDPQASGEKRKFRLQRTKDLAVLSQIYEEINQQ